ncbi:MAG: hypothetical protein ACI4V4_02785 [Eubacterium sp.]
MKLDGKRILRTAIQSAAGAAAALVTALSADFSKESLVTAAIQFGCTVIIAVLMNIKEQAGE